LLPSLNAQIPAFRVPRQEIAARRPSPGVLKLAVDFLSPAEHHAGCAVRTLFSSACSNGRSNYYLSSRVRLFIHRAYFRAPAAERCYWHEIAATILPDLRGSSPKLPAVTIMSVCTAAILSRSCHWVMCGRRLGKYFLTHLQHWSGAVMCPACLCDRCGRWP